MAEPSRSRNLPTREPTGTRVAVVGAGPSGLACAHELALRGHEVVVLDEHATPGGLLVQGIPEHRLPREVLSHETDWILGHGIEFRGGVRLGKDVKNEGSARGRFRRPLPRCGCDGRPAAGSTPGRPRPATSPPSTCCAPTTEARRSMRRGNAFLVVGGGDAAIDAARTLIRLGAGSVRILYRRSRQEMPAHPEEVVAAEQEGIELTTQVTPVEVLGTDRARGLCAIRTEPGDPDASGRRSPVPVPGSEEEIQADDHRLRRRAAPGPLLLRRAARSHAGRLDRGGRRDRRDVTSRRLRRGRRDAPGRRPWSTPSPTGAVQRTESTCTSRGRAASSCRSSS